MKSKDHLFMFKTTIMVNKRENIYCIISIPDKRLSSFFISLILTLSFYYFLFFPTFFVLILSYLSGTCTFFFADMSGRNLLSSFGHFQAELFSQVRGCTCTQCTPPPPPAYAPVLGPTCCVRLHETTTMLALVGACCV